MKNTPFLLLMLAVLLVPFRSAVNAQYPQIKIMTVISDGRDSAKTVHWGVDPDATTGIDPFLGEIEQAPIPPAGVLDARFVGDSLDSGTMVDLRRFNNNIQIDTFRIRYQPSLQGGYPMKIKWSKDSVQKYYLSSVRLLDNVGPGGILLNIDMKLQDSVVITSTSFNTVRIVASGPRGPNTIRGVVYDDLDANGIKNPSDPPVPGWKIMLSGELSDTTVTDAAGEYRFTDLPDGVYNVAEEHPAGWVQTAPPGATYAIALSGGDVQSGKNFGNYQPGSVAGKKFNDQNANQVQDPGEPGIAGWKIRLDGAVQDTQLTDGSGGYAFTGLMPGTYFIHEIEEPDWVQIKPSVPGYYTVNLTSGLHVTDRDFGNKQVIAQIIISAKISDGSDSSRTVRWGVDPTATKGINSLLGEVEQPPIPPVGSLDGRFVGDSLGSGTMVDIHKFVSNAQVDTYRIRYQPSLQGGYPMKVTWSKTIVQQRYLSSVRLLDDVGGGGSLLNIDMKLQDSVVITDTRFNTVRIVASGPRGANEIKGLVFNDINGDGVKGVSDPPIAGWKVFVSGGRVDSALTDGAGKYLLTNLPDGNYLVTEIPPPGWLQTAPAGLSYSVSLAGGDVYANANFGNFQLGSVSGKKFNDQNANQVQDVGESAVPGWKIHLEGARRDSVLTDGDGEYSFANLGAGVYRVREQQDSAWVQIKPGAPGYYTFTMTSGLNVPGADFGNKLANVFVGTPGGSWSDSSNWSFGHPPDSTQVVVIHSPVVVDQLVNASLLGLRIGEGGSISYATAESLTVLGGVQIDSGGILVFPGPLALGATSAALVQPNLICYGDWSNQGTFIPGGSLITMAGNNPKIIEPTTFYDLEIRGANTSSGGNIGILNTLFLREVFDLADDDTLVILNPAAEAIADTGSVSGGTIKRAVQAGEAVPYRFSDPGTTLRFDPGGTLPAFMLVTLQADTQLPSFALNWKIVGGVANPEANTVSFDSVTEFSKWALGGPKPQSTYGQPTVNRSYVIEPTGGSGFSADLQLSYHQSEVPPGGDESSLMLLKDPFVVAELRENWNIVSVPVLPPSNGVADVFPAATTQAYHFNDGYVTGSEVEFGKGYWIKFPAGDTVFFEGDDQSYNEIALEAGWNMIGALSVPVPASAVVTDPPGILSGSFYGYRGSYFQASVLEPASGYWIKANAAGTAVLSASSIPFGKGAGEADRVAPGNVLTVRDRAGREQNLYYTFNQATDRERFLFPPLPPDGAFDVRFGSGYGLEVGGVDKRETPIHISSAVYPVGLRWSVNESTAGAALIIGEDRYALNDDGSALVETPGTPVYLSLDTALSAPKSFELRQAYPNPFNPSTTIGYTLPEASHVILRVYNLLGEEITTLRDGPESAGEHSVVFDARQLPSGVYFYRIQAGNVSAVRKVLFLR